MIAVYWERIVKFRWVVLIIVVGMFARGIKYILPSIGIEGAANLSNVSAIFQYMVMFCVGWLLLRRLKSSVSEMFGSSMHLEGGLVGAATGILFLGATFGVNAIAVLTVANYDAGFAYDFWNFHSGAYVLSIPLITHLVLIANQFVVAPIVE